MTCRRAALLLSLAGSLALPGCEPPPPVGKEVGNTCPEIAGRDADGNEVKLSDLRGKVVMVSFWGTWCGPCRASLPHEKRMIQYEYKDRPLAILGIAADPPDKLREFLAENKLPWANIADPERALSKEWGVQAYPSVILVDHKGVIRHVWRGGVNPNDLQTEIKLLVGRAE